MEEQVHVLLLCSDQSYLEIPKTNQEKKEMFSKELKQHTTLAFRVKANGCNEDVYCFFTDRRSRGEKPQK